MSSSSSHSWPMWRRQVLALAGQELRRSARGRRALPLWLLALLPVAVAALRALFMPDAERATLAVATTEFAEVYHFFILRFVVFFGVAYLFVKLFRGPILERSLHYTLLAPLRRELLVLGKYLGGIASAALVLVPSVAVTWVLIYLPHGGGATLRYLGGAGLGQLASYLAVTVLACLAYGALFLLAGLFFKNPMVPAVLFLGWEMLSPFLPTLLKRLSVVHYLGALTPVPIAHGPFALLAQPVAPTIAVLALILAPIALLALASWRARSLEVTYSSD